MGIDPSTGMYTPDVSYQPTGAMGAVTNLLNAQKAQQIADTLQQQREAQANLQTSQAQQYAETTQRQNQARQAVADYLQQKPNAGPDELANVAAPYEDPGEWTKQYRAYQGLQGRLGAANAAAGARVESANINQGVTGAPLPLAKADQAEGAANLLNTKAQLAPEEAAALNNLRNSTAVLARARAQFVKQGGAADQRSLGYIAQMVKVNTANAAALEKSMAYMSGDESVIADVQAAKDQAAYWTSVLRTHMAGTGAGNANPYAAPSASGIANDLVTNSAPTAPQTPTTPGVPNMGHDGKTAKNPLGLDLP